MLIANHLSRQAFSAFKEWLSFRFQVLSVIKGRNETPIETDTLPMRTAVQRCWVQVDAWSFESTGIPLCAITRRQVCQVFSVLSIWILEKRERYSGGLIFISWKHNHSTGSRINKRVGGFRFAYVREAVRILISPTAGKRKSRQGKTTGVTSSASFNPLGHCMLEELEY